MIVKKLIRDIRLASPGYLIFCTDMQQIYVIKPAAIARLEAAFPFLKLLLPDQQLQPEDIVVVYRKDDQYTLNAFEITDYEPDALTTREESFIDAHFVEGFFAPPPGNSVVQMAVRDLVYRNWLIFKPADAPDIQSGYVVTEKYTKRKPTS